jgi:hypothetical protein
VITEQTYTLELTIDETLGLFTMMFEGKRVLEDDDRKDFYLGNIEQVDAAYTAYYKVADAMRWALKTRTTD